MGCALPTWVRSRVGSGRLLLIAPHGGLSARDLLEPPASPPRSNDLYTAELALALAERCDASLLANTSLDRNQLDLNRLRDVRGQAPWLLDAIAEHVERILDRHGHAEVVFVHGWHIVQPKCDIGVGETLDDSGSVGEERPGLTVSADYLRARLAHLRAGCARVGIATAYGERWPAAHPNNLMQVFRRRSARPFDGPAARLAAWARAGRICATQLELGAPLRWPGRMRDAFCDAAIAAFAGDAHGKSGTLSSARDSAPSPSAPSTVDGHRAGSLGRAPVEAAGVAGGALRVFDPLAGPGGIAIAAAMGVMPGGRLAARLIVLPGGPALALFTGEERSPEAGRVGGLSLVRSARGVHLRFSGPVLLAPDGRRHFQSEGEQAKARIVPLDLRLDLASEGAEFGAAEGEVEIDGGRFALSARGFATPPISRTPSAVGGSLTRLCAAFGGEAGLIATVERPTGERVGRRLARDSSSLATVGEVHPIERSREFVLALDGEPVRCRPRTDLAWLRSLPGGRYARVTLGTASFSWAAERAVGYGFFEHVEDVSEAVAQDALGDPASEDRPDESCS